MTASAASPTPPVSAGVSGQQVWRGWCHGAADTRAVGSALAAVVMAGDVLVLTGRLGAGKTTLVQGLARGLGIGVPVTSPTFVIARELTGGRVPLVHVDAYRLASGLELDDLDLDSDLADAVVVVEWGSGIAERLSTSRLDVVIDRDTGGEARDIEVRAVGPRWTGVDLQGLLAPLAAALPTSPLIGDHGENVRSERQNLTVLP